MAKRFLKLSLNTCIRWAHEIVSDNKGIQDYVRDRYGREAHLIAYGGDHAMRQVNHTRQQAILDFYGVRSGGYDLSICRIEPENNCHITLEVYAANGRDMMIVGNWNHSDYSRDLYNRYKRYGNLKLVRPVYDLDILYALRNNARCYVHGHRAGGTNPRSWKRCSSANRYWLSMWSITARPQTTAHIITPAQRAWRNSHRAPTLTVKPLPNRPTPNTYGDA